MTGPISAPAGSTKPGSASTPSAAASPTAQWLRRVSFVVADQLGNGIELGALRLKFQIKTADKYTPQSASVRVYNLSDATANKIQKEYSQCVLQAGYQNGPFAVIFAGTIKQVRKGRESSINSYVDIFAGDGDPLLNLQILNYSLAAGSSPDARLTAACQGATIGYNPGNLTAPTLPRGKTVCGMSRDELLTQSVSNGLTYSIQQGKIVFLPLAGFKPNQAVVVNAKTGMIGWPEQTENGIKVRVLLNPQLQIGCKLQIDNKSILIQQASQSIQDPYGTQAMQNPSDNPLQALVPLDADGLYRIYVLDMTGDTRGNDWYSDIICLAADSTSVPPSLIQKGQA